MIAVGGLDDHSRASACDEHDPPHRGMGRTTRIQRSSRLITGSAARGGWVVDQDPSARRRQRAASDHADHSRPGRGFSDAVAASGAVARRTQIGRPRTRPDAVRGDKAYSSRATRTQLRERGIKAVIPEPRDQQGHRERRGPRGGRPVVLDAADHKNRNVIERRFCHTKAMARPRHPLRQTRDRLPSCRPHPRRNRLDPRFVRHALTLPPSGRIWLHLATSGACDRITRCQSSLSALSTSATSPTRRRGGEPAPKYGRPHRHS